MNRLALLSGDFQANQRAQPATKHSIRPRPTVHGDRLTATTATCSLWPCATPHVRGTPVPQLPNSTRARIRQHHPTIPPKINQLSFIQPFNSPKKKKRNATPHQRHLRPHSVGGMTSRRANWRHQPTIDSFIRQSTSSDRPKPNESATDERTEKFKLKYANEGG